MKKELSIPIYDAVLHLVVTDDIGTERARMTHWFGPVPAADTYDALCSYGAGHNFALFFTHSASRCLKVVAHEVFHLTHRILDWSGANFDSDHHEQAALLNGYLFELVWREVAP